MDYKIWAMYFVVTASAFGGMDVTESSQPVSGFDTGEFIRVKQDHTTKDFLPEGEAKMALTAADRLTPCPKTPNCVSSLAESTRHYIEPIAYKGALGEAQQKLLEILNSFKGVRQVRREQVYVQAEFVSPIFRFVDDAEFFFDDATKKIAVKSASRIGYSDLGVNRRRIEKIRKLFDQKDTLP